MPNISLLTLSWIPGINRTAMTQRDNNSCGAYATVGAVGAFGAFTPPVELSYRNYGPQAVCKIAIIEMANDYHELSASVYAVTGILNNESTLPGAPVVPELLNAGNVYNSPAAMAKVTMDMGRSTPQINVQPAGFRQLDALYPGAQTRWEAIVGADNINTQAGEYTPPNSDETNVVCVSNSSGPFWVAQGSNGLFYNPADGSLDNSWSPVNTGDPVGPYTFAGLWMVIRAC